MNFSRAIFSQTNSYQYQKLERSASKLGIDISGYRRMSADRLDECIIEQEGICERILRGGSFNEWASSEEYGRAKVLAETLKYMRDAKRKREESVILETGMTYYRAIERNGRVIGYRTTYLGEGKNFAWSRIDDSVRKLKIMEVLRVGSDQDFKKLYYELADGRPLDAVTGFTISHLTESSERAMRLMEEYCDSRWEGKWPWQIQAPKKLKDEIMENQRKMKTTILAEARRQFDETYGQLLEGEVEKAKVVIAAQGFVEKVSGMIEDLGKLSASFMTDLKDETRTEYGEHVADQLEQAANEKIGSAVDALGDLKSALTDQIAQMEGEINGTSVPGGFGGPTDHDEMMGDMGGFGMGNESQDDDDFDVGDDGDDDFGDDDFDDEGMEDGERDKK